jgi:DNA-binding XRE family transcriptional regulator
MVNSQKLYELIGGRIRRIREGQTPRVSQEDLANSLSLKRTSVTNIEKGNQKLTLETVYQICERFGLEIHEVLPPVTEVVLTEEQSVVVGGKSHELGFKTASVVARLRPNDHSR